MNIEVIADKQFLYRIYLTDVDNQTCTDFLFSGPDTPEPTAIHLETQHQLSQYLSGKRTDFTLPTQPIGTVFQSTVWEALKAIPYGETISYQTLANRIGHPKAVRAVALANKRNPLPLIIPCHRVIYANGELGGYALGLPLKRKLLALETSNYSC